MKSKNFQNRQAMQSPTGRAETPSPFLLMVALDVVASGASRHEAISCLSKEIRGWRLEIMRHL